MRSDPTDVVTDLRAENARLRAEIDHANERAGKAEAALDVEKGLVAPLRESYEKVKGMLLRRQKRDNDLDKAQIEELTQARNRWDTQVLFQQSAPDGSAMRTAMDASAALISLLERNYAIVMRANERVVAERDSKTHSAACVFCDWKGPDRKDWNEANCDVATHDCKKHPYLLERDEVRAELASLKRQQSEAATAVPSDALREAAANVLAILDGAKALCGVSVPSDRVILDHDLAIERLRKALAAAPEPEQAARDDGTVEWLREQVHRQGITIARVRDYLDSDGTNFARDHDVAEMARYVVERRELAWKEVKRLETELAALRSQPARPAVPEDMRVKAEELLTWASRPVGFGDRARELAQWIVSAAAAPQAEPQGAAQDADGLQAMLDHAAEQMQGTFTGKLLALWKLVEELVRREIARGRR